MTIVQSLWFGRPLSVLEKKSINSYLNLGYEFHLYVYDNVKGIPDGVIIKDASEIIPKDERFQENFPLPFADFWRFVLLYNVGGIWVDLDMIALRRFPFETKPFVFSSEHTVQAGTLKSKNLQTPNIGIIKVPSKHPMMEELVLKCKRVMTRGTIQRNDKTRFMKIFKKMLIKHNLEKWVVDYKTFCPLHWWHTKEAFLAQDKYVEFKKKFGVDGYTWKSILENPNCYSVHMWRNLAVHRHQLDLNELVLI
jgi:hypothetical protein